LRLKIGNVATLQARGIIDQNRAAQMLTGAPPALPEPPFPTAGVQGAQGGSGGLTGIDAQQAEPGVNR
jgi:hypothetical protein